MAEKDEYHIAASSVDVEYDLWEFWRDNRMRIPHWYSVAKDMTLMQPSSAFMERVFSILRACMDERQESSYSDRIASSALVFSSTTEGEGNSSSCWRYRVSFGSHCDLKYLYFLNSIAV